MDVTAANFETEVLLASQSVPVLVDFWAPWCGPCKSLGPILEKLEVAYGGRFKLCKINSDDEQQLAAAFGIRSLPTCVLLVNGQPVDGFMGAQPEGQVRAFLDKHLGADDGQDAAEDDTLDAEQEGDESDRLERLAQTLAQDPSNNDVRFDYCKHLISEGLFEDAQAALAPALAQIPLQLRFDGLNRWLQALVFVDGDPRGQWTLDQFDAQIAQNKRDFDTRFAKAQLLMASGQWPEAMDELLEIIMRDKAWNDEAPRKMMVGMLELMTPPAPKPPAGAAVDKGSIQIAGATTVQQDPQMELISRYRRKLSMALN